MEAIRVERLCCIKLPHAGLAVGFLTSIICFLNIVDLISVLIAFDGQEPSFHINSYRSREIIALEVFGYFLVLLSGWLLIQGTLKKSHLMILPWLILTGCVILFGFVFALFLLIFGVIGNWNKDFGQLYIMIFLGTLFLPALGIYIWFGIYSLYRNIKEKKQEALAQVEAKGLCDPQNSNPEILITPKHC